MKYNFESITPAKYLDMVNRADDPDTTKLKIHYYKIGENQYLAYANFDRGKIMSPIFNRRDIHTDKHMDDYFDDITAEITGKFNQYKNLEQIAPNFLPFSA